MWRWYLFCICALLALVQAGDAQNVNKKFHNAPESAKNQENPLSDRNAALAQGKRVYARNCLACHGRTGKGTGDIPSLVNGKLAPVSEGEIFWFITRGDKGNGMPNWASLPEKQRWAVVTYVKSLTAATATGTAAVRVEGANVAAPPSSTLGPFTDFRDEKPGMTHRITVSDLPPPYATRSADNHAEVVERPANAWPVAPEGFKVELYSAGLGTPRLLRTAPNGDIFLAESGADQIRVYRGISAEGKPEQTEVFASGLRQPYGIAFYPPGPDPQWVYVGNTDEVIRFPYRNGDMKARGAAEHIATLPVGGHWTRAVDFSLDGKKMFVAVGSASNVDDTDNNPDEKDRADILSCAPEHCELSVYAYGIRNAGGGIRVSPDSGELWCSTNERDALGDNLVPDYITHVQEGGFYGWPWWYIGAHQDPRHKGKHPELKEKVIVPDVLLQPHNASLELTFYEGAEFPAEYRGDIFASQHGSWNKAVRTGYEVIRVPLHRQGRASGDYQDFLTGFVLPDGQVWGRPVGVTVAADGSLLVSDDGSNSIWRVSYTGNARQATR